MGESVREISDKKMNLSSLREIYQLILPYKKQWRLGIIYAFVGIIVSMQIPLIIQIMTKGILNDNISFLWIGFIWLVLIQLVGYFIARFRFRHYNTYIFRHSIHDLRQNLVNKMLKHSYKFIDENSSGDLNAIATGDVMTIAHFLAWQMHDVLVHLVQLVIITIVLFIINATLTLILICFLPAIFIIVFIYRKKIHPVTYQQRSIFGKMSSILNQNIGGIQVVKIFTNEDSEVEKFRNINEEYKDFSWKVGKLSSLTHPIIDAIWGFAQLLLVAIGGYYVMTGKQTFLGETITLDEMAAFIPALDFFLFPMILISWISGEFGKIQASFDRLNEIFKYPIDISEKDDSIIVPELKGDITFKNVTFGYDSDHPVIKNLSMEIKSGSTIAFLGATGSGKTTLVNLLMRFYDIQEGEILLDNKYNIQDINLESFRKQVGIVAQEPFLFQRSFKENLIHGLNDKEEITKIQMEEIKKVCQFAQIDEFIQTRDDKYETVLGERGINLSGGQKQRVTIARALFRNPRILILDDATSAVDVDTEYEIILQLKEIFQHCTTILITQRLSTIREADHIYVLHNGEIAEHGNHEDLIKLNQIYADLYKTITYSPEKKKKTNNMEVNSGGA